MGAVFPHFPAPLPNKSMEYNNLFSCIKSLPHPHKHTFFPHTQNPLLKARRIFSTKQIALPLHTKSPHNSSFPPNGTGILRPHTHKTGDKCESCSPYNSKLEAGVKWDGSGEPSRYNSIFEARINRFSPGVQTKDIPQSPRGIIRATILN